MKPPFRLLNAVAVALALLAVTGCKTVSVSSYQYVGGPIYAPSDPAQVQILRIMPNRTHARLGEVTAQPSSQDVDVQKIDVALRKAAAKMGADAVVIVSDRTHVTGAFVTGPWYARTVQQTTGRVIVSVAIKYIAN